LSGIEVTRRTVKSTVSLSGRGLHGGEPVEVRIHPGAEGIGFRLGDRRFAAIPENVTDTTRCTRLGEISTIEHVMSALAGLEVTDAEIELSKPELPGLDGSAAEYVDAIRATGLATAGTAHIYPPFKRVFLQEEPISLAAARGDGHWRFEYLTGNRWPGIQVFEVPHVSEGYVKEIARARTFALAEELPTIKQMGLGQGLDESSALILGPNGYENAPRFEDEPARHKLLDLIGDLYLSGIPVGFLNVVAVRSGHRTNVAFAKLLADASRREAALAER
jgi:UDP-3-O-[3-hydroxymyristoyl] N-acetylglucosamine deacetylase